ncbi:hypothetical protein ES703_43018 [subsurface metagenome]
MPDFYLSDTRRLRDFGDGTCGIEYYDVGSATWIKEKKPATIQLWPAAATIPGVGDGYGTPCYCHLIMGGAGQNHAYWQLEFDPDAEEVGFWDFALPPNFDPTKDIKLSVFWIAETLITGDVIWGVSVLGRHECQAWDAALGTEVEVVDTTHGTIKSVVKTEITLTAAQHALAADDAVILQLARKATDGCDTLNEDADVIMAKLDIAINPAILITGMP